MILAQLTALAHPRRLAIFRLLMRRYPEAVAAGDLAMTLDLPASSLSAAVAQLYRAGLVTQHRHGTSLRYAADVAGAGRLTGYLVDDCCRGRGAFCPQDVGEPAEGGMVMDRKWNVLFICSGNSARSIFAEAILRDWAGDRFAVYSAGTRPQSELNPRALDLLDIKGHDTAGLRAKHVSEFQTEAAPKMDFVFTVCDQAANEECPPWPGQPVTGHWGQPDPARATGTDAERMLAFRQAYGSLQNRIKAFAALPIAALDRASLQARVDDIARDITEEDV